MSSPQSQEPMRQYAPYPTILADMRVVVAGFPESGMRDIAEALLDRLAAAEARAERAETEARELRAEVNGTEWENNLLVNAPEWLDDDVAQCDLVTRYVRWLEAEKARADGVVSAARRVVAVWINDTTMVPDPYFDSERWEAEWDGSHDDLAAALTALDEGEA